MILPSSPMYWMRSLITVTSTPLTVTLRFLPYSAGLDDREGDVELVVEDVVHPLFRAARVNFSPHINSPIGETDLFTNLSVEIPSSRNKAGRDELRADVAFTKGFFVHAE